MISPTDVILFDLDDTLVRSFEFDEVLFKEAISEVVGLPDFNSNWESYTHVTNTGILTELLANHGIKERDKVFDDVRGTFCRKLEAFLESGATCDPLPGARETLDALTAANIRFGVATGGWEETARLKLKHAGIDEPDVLSSSNDAISRVSIMEHCLRQLGAEGSRAVYFGDGPWDVKATAVLGWRFIGVGSRLADKCEAWISDFSDPAWRATLKGLQVTVD